VEPGERLIGKKYKYDVVPSSAKGKTFEEEIRYTLKTCQKLMQMPCKIDEKDRTKACDIRLHVQGLGVVGIEAKNKAIISKADVVKFNKDRIENHFAASIFWSKATSEDNENGHSFRMEGNSVLYLQSLDFKQSVDIIYLFLLCLKTSKAAEGDNSQFSTFIIKMFDMLKNHYCSFGKLKDEVRKLDKLLLNDIECIEDMCRKTLKLKIKPTDLNGHLYLACKSNIKYDGLGYYEKKGHQVNKGSDFFNRKQASNYRNQFNSPLFFKNIKAESSPKKLGYTTVATLDSHMKVSKQSTTLERYGSFDELGGIVKVKHLGKVNLWNEDKEDSSVCYPTKHDSNSSIVFRDKVCVLSNNGINSSNNVVISSINGINSSNNGVNLSNNGVNSYSHNDVVVVHDDRDENEQQDSDETLSWDDTTASIHEDVNSHEY